MNVQTPNGDDVEVPMNDEGLAGDVTPNDGIYGGELIIEHPGQYVVQPVLTGFYDLPGAEITTEFVRSTQHLVTVSPVRLEFTGKARMVRKDSDRMIISVGVTEVNPGGTFCLIRFALDPPTFLSLDGLRAHTEVYGKKGNDLVPVAWLGGLVDIENGWIALELDARWLQRAGVSGSLVLRNSYIADVTTSFPIATYFDDIAVDNSDIIPIPGFVTLLNKPPMPITYEMRNGVNPLFSKSTFLTLLSYIQSLHYGALLSSNLYLNPILSLDRTAASTKKGLVLIPGYCATINPWKRNSGDFTNAHFFDEMNLNVPNDEVCHLIIQFIYVCLMSVNSTQGRLLLSPRSLVSIRLVSLVTLKVAWLQRTFITITSLVSRQPLVHDSFNLWAHHIKGRQQRPARLIWVRFLELDVVATAI